MNGTPLPQILWKFTLVSQLLVSNPKISKIYILISTYELFRTMTKNKTKVILMEPINTLKTIISTIGGFLLQIFK